MLWSSGYARPVVGSLHMQQLLEVGQSIQAWPNSSSCLIRTCLWHSIIHTCLASIIRTVLNTYVSTGYGTALYLHIIITRENIGFARLHPFQWNGDYHFTGRFTPRVILYSNRHLCRHRLYSNFSYSIIVMTTALTNQHRLHSMIP